MSADIVPAIIPTSRQSVITDSERLAFSAELHLDVVDGDFVPASSWPYEPADDPLSVRSALETFTLEVDLMVSQPLLAAASWLKAGADMLVFHAETIAVEDLARFDEQHKKCTIGIAANNDTPLSTLLAYLPYVDYVQVMGIATIGSQGQPFDERALSRIQDLRTAGVSLPISIDGSVNEHTIERLSKAGAERLVVGSAIVKTDHPAQAYRTLQTLAG